MMTALFIGIGLIIGSLIGLVLFKVQQNQIIKAAKDKSSGILSSAKRKAKDIESNAEKKSREAVDKSKRDFKRSIEKESEESRRALDKAKIIEKEAKAEREEIREIKENAESSLEKSTLARKDYERLSESAEKAEKLFKEDHDKIKIELEKVAGMTQKEAKESLIQAIEDEAKLSSAKRIRLIEEETKEESEKLSKRIISIAISRYASDYINERTTSSVSLPDDQMKGRLIGREGRNIRAIEAATGCDLIIDDTPETVIVSCFDPVRRYIGKTVLEGLINDGRVHPTRIEEIVEKTKKNTNKQIKEYGEKALLELNIVGMHPELVKVIGQLQFRFSYSQNQYRHVIEAGHLCGVMAAELGLDVKKARRAGLLHDIGKAMTHEIDGSHAVIGADLCEKYNEAPDIVYAIRAHHEDVKPQSWLDFLVIAGDAISGARPGARREQLDNYVRRLEDLENIGNSFPGVERTFALAAGREIRVMVQNSKISDEKSIILSRDIAQKIEQDMTYPGQIKVTVIRETRSTTLAK